MTVQYRKLGRTGEEVSILGFGAMRLPVIGGDEGRIDEEAATQLLHHAVERGVNYVDTAWSYHRGNSERWLGEVLEGGLRQKVHLATKLPSWEIQTREDCDRYLNEQLARLKTPHIDFYLLHTLTRDWWNKLRDLGVLEFLDSALREGRIRYAGFSFHDDFSLFQEIVDAYDWSFCQIQYNYMDELYQAGRKGLEYAFERDLGVVVMEPLRGGTLAGRLPADIVEIMEGHMEKRTPAEWALRWVWNHPEVSLALSGMNSLDQLEENVATASNAGPGSMSEEELDVIRRVREKYRERESVPCTVCGYCLPCPEGVNIPKIFSFYNEGAMFSDWKEPSGYYRDMMNPDERVPNCVECGDCEETCPQHIAIIEELISAHRFLSGEDG